MADHDDTERDEAWELPPPPGGRAKGSVTMAAMLGLAEALGFDKQVEVVEASTASSGQALDLDFGDLPPLD